VALRKIEGVETVTVSLNDGAADIRLKPGNSVDPEAVRKVVRDNGFTPKEADVTVTGQITRSDGKWMLRVTETAIDYELREDSEASGQLDELEGRTASEVTLSGRLPESGIEPTPDSPRILDVLEIDTNRP
jgi:hypothetical protein